jgi:hypothetical protein
MSFAEKTANRFLQPFSLPTAHFFQPPGLGPRGRLGNSGRRQHPRFPRNVRAEGACRVGLALKMSHERDRLEKGEFARRNALKF